MKRIRINNFEEHLYYDKLSNGLEVFVVPIKNKKSFSAMLVTKYGGRDINFKINDKVYNTPTGIAHFLEHKMFEREEDPFAFYGKFGTDVNASTSDDYTGYYFVGSKCFDKSLKYLLNWIQSLSIDDALVEKEKGIILEEASMYTDNPNRIMHNKIKECVFVNDPKKNKVIGTDEDIKRITKDELQLCYNNFYVPDNMLLIVAGNVDPKKVFDITNKETKSFNKNNNNVVPFYESEPDYVAKKTEELFMNVSTPRVCLSYKINKDCFKELSFSKFELDLYLQFLINISLGVTSKIRQKWILKEMFTDAFYRMLEIESHYILQFHAYSEKVDELVSALIDYVKDLKIDLKSFEREKKIWIANEIRAIENPISTIYNVLDDVLDYDGFIPNKIEIIRNLTYGNLIKVKECMDYNNYSVIKILPLQSSNKNL